ncbi:MAG TPA: HAD-IA family hydrolase [Candidatus Saccharimonadales bacterium]|nr:HAD-IA family hydrolase [Candidatus Saccharimonadales bacterium]
MPEKKQYDTYLIDWDGTAACTLAIWLGALQQAHAKRGLYSTDRELAAGFGDWNHSVSLGVKDISVFKKDVVASALELCMTPTLYPGTKDKLEELHSDGKKLALVSSSSRDLLMHAVEHTGLASLFDVVIAAEDVANHKPHPESIELALHKLGSQAASTVLVGDSDKDLGAAQNAGIDCIFFNPAEHAIFYDKDDLVQRFNPVRTITQWQEL